jgi:hypothetical protein
MEQKFGKAVTISERLIHTAYNNRLSPGALHREVLLEIVKYVNEIADNSELLSFVHQPSDLSGGNFIRLQAQGQYFCFGAPCTTQLDATI